MHQQLHVHDIVYAPYHQLGITVIMQGFPYDIIM
jgi:hypothetical protein